MDYDFLSQNVKNVNIYVWIYENNVKRIRTLPRHFSLARDSKVDDIKPERIVVFFFLHSFTLLLHVYISFSHFGLFLHGLEAALSSFEIKVGAN